MVWHERFLLTGLWASEEGQEFEKFSKKNAVYLISSGKNKFHHFWTPVEKLLEKSTSAPFGKMPIFVRIFCETLLHLVLNLCRKHNLIEFFLVCSRCLKLLV